MVGLWSVSVVCGLIGTWNQPRDTCSACRIPGHDVKRVNVDLNAEMRRHHYGFKADCSPKCVQRSEDLRLADVVSDMSYRYPNSVSWEIECL